MQEQDKDLLALKALAQAATPGKWYSPPAYPNEVFAPDRHATALAKCDYGAFKLRQYDDEDVANARWIAAANPAAILSLISRIEQQAARIAELEALSSAPARFANSYVQKQEELLKWKQRAEDAEAKLTAHPSPAVDLSGLTRYTLHVGPEYSGGAAMVQSERGAFVVFGAVQSLLSSAPVVREGKKLTPERVMQLYDEAIGKGGSADNIILNTAWAIEREVLATGKEMKPYEIAKMKGQAKAWLTVAGVLSELRPGWEDAAPSGIGAAVATIRALATPSTPSQASPAPSDKGTMCAPMVWPERDLSKPAEQQGVFRKFDVRRVDGSDQPGGKHHGCRYFVLDLDHDKHAPTAMRAYAADCARTHPELSAELIECFGKPDNAPVAEMREMLGVQGQGGTWDYDHYMHGMYNGMEYMLAMVEGRDPNFREAPAKWLSDKAAAPVATPSQAWNGELPDFDDELVSGELSAQFSKLRYDSKIRPGIEAYARKAIGAAVAGVLDAALEVLKHRDNRPLWGQLIDTVASRDALQKLSEVVRSLSSNPVSLTERSDIERDAARYRWLRRRDNCDACDLTSRLWDEQLDAAIDSAIRAASNGNGEKGGA